jgi:hypothetical protein
MARADAGGLDQVGYAVSDDPCFTAARARQYQQRPFDILNGLTLGFI